MATREPAKWIILGIIAVTLGFLVARQIPSARPRESLVVEASTVGGYNKVEIVEYGTTLVSEGYIASKGTKLYPVK